MHPILYRKLSASGGSTAINHILTTGQSNAIGVSATPLLSTLQPYSNRKFSAGTRAESNLTSFASLIEDTRTDLDDGTKTDGETIASSMLNFIYAKCLANGITHEMLSSNHARSGYRYDQLAKGTAPYTRGQSQVIAAKSIANNSGFDHRIAAVCCIHGEADQSFARTNYSGNLQTWQANYQSDCQSITGQSDIIPFLACQQNIYAPANAASQGVATAIELYKANIAAPTKILLVTPRYIFDYVADGIHLTNHSQRWLGEYYGKVYFQHLIQGNQWRPLSPRTATLNANIIDIEFYVPVPPLVFDYSLVVAPNLTALGFEYFDSTSPPAITSVALTGATTVRITLASTPTGTGKQIRYGYTATSTASAGRWIAARGNLRDSDSTVSQYGFPLYNWCVQFAVDLP